MKCYIQFDGRYGCFCESNEEKDARSSSGLCVLTATSSNTKRRFRGSSSSLENTALPMVCFIVRDVTSSTWTIFLYFYSVLRQWLKNKRILWYNVREEKMKNGSLSAIVVGEVSGRECTVSSRRFFV